MTTFELDVITTICACAVLVFAFLYYRMLKIEKLIEDLEECQRHIHDDAVTFYNAILKSVDTRTPITEILEAFPTSPFNKAH